MPKGAATLLASYVGDLTALDHMRMRLEELGDAGSVPMRQVLLWYEVSFLRVVALFESLVEDLFIGLLCGTIGSALKSVKPLVGIRSPRVAWSVVLGGRKYVNWLPYEETVGRATGLLSSGEPFTRISNSDREFLGECVVIRNAIAHRSRFARRQFERRVIKAVPVPPHERTPGGFLRGRFRSFPAQTRYEVRAARLAECARQLCV